MATLGFALCTSASAQDVCWDSARAASESKNWNELHTHLQHGCGGAVWAELQAEGVTRLLTHHWDTLPELRRLGELDPAFLDRVLSLIGDSTPQTHAAAIRASASSSCPLKCEPLCKKLLRQLEPPSPSRGE